MKTAEDAATTLGKGIIVIKAPEVQQECVGNKAKKWVWKNPNPI